MKKEEGEGRGRRKILTGCNGTCIQQFFGYFTTQNFPQAARTQFLGPANKSTLESGYIEASNVKEEQV
jgi:hypothetical protein